MCGICGAFRADGPAPASPDVIEKMQGQLVHRGPDDEGSYFDANIALGFRRLSIVDLDGGNQPIQNEDGQLCLICNGEIFNAPELRDDLARRGHRFATGSDVEVILHLYEEKGEALLEDLNGQFAFVLYDSKRRSILCARDPFGVTPFYYTWVNDVFVFASEVKAILQYPGVERCVDLTALDQILSLPGLVSPRTMFHGVHSLRPGYTLSVDSEGEKERAYWDLHYPHAGDMQHNVRTDWAEALNESLEKSVKYRLMSDVPVGAYLSGGLDSALISVEMAQHLPKAPDCFSILFDDPMFDEGSFQKLMAQQIGAQRHSAVHPPAEISDMLTRMTWHAECPVKESYNTASMVLSGSARSAGVPVVLSGEGADELFAGYVGYKYDAFRAARGEADASHEEAELRTSAFGDPTIFYEKELVAHQKLRRQMYSSDLQSEFEAFRYTNFPVVDGSMLKDRHPVHQRSYLDFKIRLADHLLGDHGDRMLMANSVEGRFPFLDKDFVAFVSTLPPELKLKDFTEKYALKKAAEGRVPQHIIDREKFAFSAPGSSYLLREKIEWIDHLLSPSTIRAQGYFDVEQVEEMKRTALETDAMPTGGAPEDPLMTVLTFGIFLDCFDMPHIGQGTE